MSENTPTYEPHKFFEAEALAYCPPPTRYHTRKNPVTVARFKDRVELTVETNDRSERDEVVLVIDSDVFYWLQSNGYQPSPNFDNHKQAHYWAVRNPKTGFTALLHRIIWILIDGGMPEQIDHINGDPSDNRFCNLRSVDNARNTRNLQGPKQGRTHEGTLGAHWNARQNVWHANATIHKRLLNFGRFTDHDEAARVADAARFILDPVHFTRMHTHDKSDDVRIAKFTRAEYNHALARYAVHCAKGRIPANHEPGEWVDSFVPKGIPRRAEDRDALRAEIEAKMAENAKKIVLIRKGDFRRATERAERIAELNNREAAIKVEIARLKELV